MVRSDSDGVLTAMVLFAQRVAHIVTVTRAVNEERGVVAYLVNGELFFASSNDFDTQFEDALGPERVVIDMHTSHLWDASTFAALDAITENYKQHAKHVDTTGWDTAILKMRDRMGGKLGGSH